MAKMDQFANLANIAVQESAANTLTFNQLTTGAGVFEKLAMIIHKIEYEPSEASVNLLQGVTTRLDMAWVTSDQITSLAKETAQVIDRLSLMNFVHGAPATGTILERPWIHDFTTLPGGGLIVPATNLYVAITGANLGSAAYMRSSMYFTYRELKPEEYWELVEATRALS